MQRFPDISDHLEAASSCAMAVKRFGGRNLAHVLLDVYTAIPESEESVRAEYVEEIGHRFVDGKLPYRDPIIFPSMCWPQAVLYVRGFFARHTHKDWYKKVETTFNIAVEDILGVPGMVSPDGPGEAARVV